jgi:ataxia telangiectasia mutated family protein
MALTDFSRKMGEHRKRFDGTPALSAQMLEWYQAAAARLQPVMRHWFTESHKVPMSWFAMRLNYTRSVATTSVVGHVLGLGDRHTRNILLDVATGAVVHIDLGIAFEQGRLLPIPEIVPFRMTRDMVDGMGAAGAHGVFQRCAEETLRVLRADSEVILTVLEVFKYDPLHSWYACRCLFESVRRLRRVVWPARTASDLKMNRAQEQSREPTAGPTGIGIDMNSAGAEEAADRALSAVSRKLDRALSIEHTVNELIAEAMDPANLCLMYTGIYFFLWCGEKADGRTDRVVAVSLREYAIIICYICHAYRLYIYVLHLQCYDQWGR